MFMNKAHTHLGTCIWEESVNENTEVMKKKLIARRVSILVLLSLPCWKGPKNPDESPWRMTLIRGSVLVFLAGKQCQPSLGKRNSILLSLHIASIPFTWCFCSWVHTVTRDLGKMDCHCIHLDFINSYIEIIHTPYSSSIAHIIQWLHDIHR